MVKKSCSALALSLMLALASCSDDAPWAGSDTEGGIRLNLSADGTVVRQTRADDGVILDTPAPEAFGISLTSSDGSYSKSWGSYEAFNHEAGFPVGEYTVAASYGDVNKEGFESPYFYGQTRVQVSPATESEATIQAGLANAMVSIRYSDQFTKNFSAYSAAVQTDGHEWIVFAQNEDRPAYVAPGNVKLNLTLTNFQDKQVTIQPAGFTASAKHHYVVTIGVDGSSGDLKLNVEFEENVVNHTVNVSLGDDLFNAPEPTVTTGGFTDGEEYSGFEFVSPVDKAEFKIFAFGGLAGTTLNIISDNNYTPTFGKSAELVEASSLLQSQLAGEGVVCSGFFRNPDKLGLINVTEFLNTLPAGKYTIEVTAKDAMTRISPAATLVLNLSTVNMVFADPAAIEYGATEIKVTVNTNCKDVKDGLVFKAPDVNNRMVEVTPVSAVLRETPGSAYPYAIDYVLKVDPQGGTYSDVEARYGNKTIRTQVPINQPDLTIEPDAYAKSVVLRISGAAVAGEGIINSLRFFNAGKEYTGASVIYPASGNLVTITGLEPNTKYTTLKAKLGSYEMEIPEFTTEPALALTNGDFSQVNQDAINITGINTGGNWTGTALSSPAYYYNTDIIRSTAAGWADVNANTCFATADPLNTWFVAPSTWVDNGQAVLQSVGYNHSGTLPSVDRRTARYYNQTAPEESQFEKAAGELFLGTYAFTTSAQRTDGIGWTSRPATLSFQYKYAPVGNEKGEAYITLLGDGDEVLATQKVLLDKADDMTTVSVNLTGYKFRVGAKKIKLGFRSTQQGVTPTLNIPSGDALNEGGFYTSRSVATNEYKAKATGSTLTIDNVTIGYDPKAASSAASAKRKSSGKNSKKK